MQSYTKKHIITGAPGTGKTSLIKALEQQHLCMHEVSRVVIKKEQLNNGHGMPWKDVERFAALVCEASITEIEMNPHASFTDRSILDLMAYLQVAGKSIPLSILNFPYHDRFHKDVFFAPTWKHIYKNDAQRPQEFQHSLELEKALETNYREKGFNIIKLPKATVSVRVNFVLGRLTTLV